MFCESGAMQLSAANLIIASQQIARGASQPTPSPAFANALSKEKGIEGAGFEPMAFKQSAPAATPAAAPAQAPSQGYNTAARLGANIDIRV